MKVANAYLIAASILAARKLAQYEPGKRAPLSRPIRANKLPKAVQHVVAVQTRMESLIFERAETGVTTVAASFPAVQHLNCRCEESLHILIQLIAVTRSAGRRVEKDDLTP
jgi:hypothetical protein